MPSTSVWIHLLPATANLKVRPGSCCEAYHQLPKRLIVSACFGHERHDSEPSRGCIEQTNLDARLVSIYCTFLQSRPCWQLSGHGFGVLWQRVVWTRATEHYRTMRNQSRWSIAILELQRLHLCGLKVLSDQDVYQLNILEAPKQRPASCVAADPDNALCQLSLDLNDICHSLSLTCVVSCLRIQSKSFS